MQSWPHAPSKRVTEPGIYIVTAGTYGKAHFFHDEQRLLILQKTLLDFLDRDGWEVMAWAVFSNHYHLVAIAPERPKAVQKLTSRVHAITSRAVNELDGTPGRQVWYQCWDTHLTFEKSVMARLAYVHNNAVKHGLAAKPEDYPFCSAAWLLEHGDAPFVKSVLSFSTDRVNVVDDF
ncbi:MAG: hypothetical protein K8R88_01290 [Armatimonadetes bacterium]|nr:hypothetical protein [Armatimonadota bacterium]